MVTVGGQSRPGGAVLVTPSGQVVGSADVAGEKSRIEKTRRKRRRSSRGGSSSSSRIRAAAAAESLKKIEEEQKRKEEQLKKEQDRVKQTAKFARIIRERRARAELQKIKDARDRIIKMGGRTRTKNLENKEGERVRNTITEINKIVDGKRIRERVFETKNLETGETTIKRFAKDNGGVRQTGGIKTTDQSLSRKQSLLPQKDVDKFIMDFNKSLEKEKTLVENESKFNKNIREFLERNIKKLSADQDTRQKQLDSAKQSFLNSDIGGFNLDKEKRHIKRVGITSAMLIVAGIQTIGRNIQGFNDLRIAAPSLFRQIIKDPKKILKIPGKIAKGLKLEGKELIALAKVSPIQFVGRIGGELITFGGSGKIIKSTGKASKKIFNKIANLDPRLLKIQAGIINIGKKGNGLVLKVGTIADVKESLAKTIGRAGKKTVAVSAQANRIVSFVKRKVIIRKPLPVDEKLLSSAVKRLLKKFDDGKIKARELMDLNIRLRVETKKLGAQAKGVDLLERSAFFDPDRVLRKSRLAIADEAVPEGTFFDLITGRATLFAKKAKPQIIVLEEYIELLPKTKEFKSIIAKIKKSKIAGKDPNLTPKELATLTKFQITPSGKLKPIGSTTFQGGLEREVTVAPGEAIKRVKKLGTLLVNGKRVPIVAVRIVKGIRKVKIIRKLERVKKKIIELNKKKNKLKSPTAKKKVAKQLLKQEENIKNITKKVKTQEVKRFIKDIRRKPKARKKIFPLRRKLGQATARARKRGMAKARKRAPVKPRPRAPVKPRPRAPVKPRPRARGGRPPTPPPRTPKKPIRLKLKKLLKKKKEKKTKTTGYNVFARPLKRKGMKRKPRLLKVNRKPINKRRAKDLRNYVADTSLSRTAKIKKTNKKTVRARIRVPVGYSKRTKKKFRSYRIVKGKKVPLKKGTVIERRTRLLDTKGERKRLSLKKRIAQLRKKPIKKKKKTTRRKKK